MEYDSERAAEIARLRQAEASAEDKTAFKHRGWSVGYDGGQPVTGVWRARRFGVGMCAGLRSEIIRMIDHKANDEAIRAQHAAEAGAFTGRV